MYELKVIKEGSIHYIQARSEAKADLIQVTHGMLLGLLDSLDYMLREGATTVTPTYRVERESNNCFLVYVGNGAHYHGYCLSKSKLTAFRNQLVGVLNG